MSRILEEGLATNILDALEQPLELATVIMGLRAFAVAKRAIDDAHGADAKVPDHPMIDTVFIIAKEIADDAKLDKDRNKRGEGTP